MTPTVVYSFVTFVGPLSYIQMYRMTYDCKNLKMLLQKRDAIASVVR